MTRLPDHQQPHAPTAGQPTINPAAQAFLNDVESAFTHKQAAPVATSYRDPNPIPAIGTTPPVPQPGRPPMSQRAVDLNTTILSTSVLVAALGGAVSAALWASGKADPTVIAWICAGIVAVPAALAIPVLALKGLMKSAKEVAQAAPPIHNHHYTGNVYQDHRQVQNKNTGVWVHTRNQLPK